MPSRPVFYAASLEHISSHLGIWSDDGRLGGHVQPAIRTVSTEPGRARGLEILIKELGAGADEIRGFLSISINFPL